MIDVNLISSVIIKLRIRKKSDTKLEGKLFTVAGGSTQPPGEQECRLDLMKALPTAKVGRRCVEAAPETTTRTVTGAEHGPIISCQGKWQARFLL